MPQAESIRSVNESAHEYIHGFSNVEQDRLIGQSTLLEPCIHTHIDFSTCNHILEVGCGVGAQMAILLRRYPNLKITGIDISEIQINRAREFLKNYIDAGRVDLHVGQGETLPFANDTFDGAFICFVLEHTKDPVAMLKEVKRVIKSDSRLYCTEVFNRGLYIHPSYPSLESYWTIFNEHQKGLNADPDIGMKLCNLALKAGFSETTLQYACAHLDSRYQDTEYRKIFLGLWTDLLLSAVPALLAENKITINLVEAVKQDIHSLKTNLDGIFVWMAMQLEAVK